MKTWIEQALEEVDIPVKGKIIFQVSRSDWMLQKEEEKKASVNLIDQQAGRLLDGDGLFYGGKMDLGDKDIQKFMEMGFLKAREAVDTPDDWRVITPVSDVFIDAMYRVLMM